MPVGRGVFGGAGRRDDPPEKYRMFGRAGRDAREPAFDARLDCRIRMYRLAGPRISAFYGIVIAMYYDDHPPPHFHAKYGEDQAQVAIETGVVLNGSLPRRALGLVQEWVLLHRDELAEDWGRAERQEPLANIEPLP